MDASARSVQLALAPLAHFAELPRIQAMLERCAQLSPGYRDATAEQLLGTLAAARAAVLGGDDGAGWFARARQLAPVRFSFSSIL